MASTRAARSSVGDVRLTLTHAFHSSSTADGEYAGEPCGFVIELGGGTRLYVAGDTCVFGDMALIARLYRPELAILPIGDRYTMGPARPQPRSSCWAWPVRPLPLRHVPGPDRHARGAAGAGAGVEVLDLAPGQVVEL